MPYECERNVNFCLCKIAEERKMERKNERNEAKGLFLRLECDLHYISFAFQSIFS